MMFIPTIVRTHRARVTWRPPVTFTNSVAVANNGKLTTSEDNLDTAVTDGSPSRDIILTEAEHIMVDYVALLGQQTEPVLSAR